MKCREVYKKDKIVFLLTGGNWALKLEVVTPSVIMAGPGAIYLCVRLHLLIVNGAIKLVCPTDTKICLVHLVWLSKYCLKWVLVRTLSNAF
jgi:hypothetical protein